MLAFRRNPLNPSPPRVLSGAQAAFFSPVTFPPIYLGGALTGAAFFMYGGRTPVVRAWVTTRTGSTAQGGPDSQGGDKRGGVFPRGVHTANRPCSNVWKAKAAMPLKWDHTDAAPARCSNVQNRS